jgi:uncharacterized protein (TIGR02001 family)
MKKNSLYLFSVLMLGSTTAIAEDALSDFNVTGFLTGTNNFMYRGLSLSDNSAAVQGQFALEHKTGFYAKLWASNTRLQAASTRGNSPNMEGNFLAGFTNKINDDLAYDVGYLRTFYPGGSGDFDFNDFYGTLMYKGVSVGLSYSDDFFNSTGDALYTFLAYDNKIINDVALHAKVGHTNLRENGKNAFFGLSGWTHYELGLSQPLPKDFNVSLVYHWTTGSAKDKFDVDGFGTNRLQFNLTKSF